MTVLMELDKLCSEAFLAMKYQNATPDNCFEFACAGLNEKERAVISGYLDQVASGQVSQVTVRSAIEAWAERFGFSIQGDMLAWLLSARSALNSIKS